MDAELLKCKRTDDAMSVYIPKTRRCLYLMSYFNSKDYSSPSDAEQRCSYEREMRVLEDHKKLLTQLINPLVKFPDGTYRPPPINVIGYSLRFLQLALLHQCSDRQVPKRGFQMFIDLTERFKRMMLGLDDDTPAGVNDLFREFAICLGDVAFKKDEIEKSIAMFACPLCVRQDVYTGIGWTPYVCPKPLGQMSNYEIYNGVISKRGGNDDMMIGECSHISSLQKSLYDWMFSRK